ncbi:WbqC-like protein family protein [Mariprofundus micogutta]|uniref:WbqC-like protein family protein n=1 Tax=Mariprofundus micogutta TaxID=1921010 RepID=A0A1L8CLF8_9PROT|nr:WbqC family protein [Mariprofundus micogutta]GAV19743.1 WbqC-like protein family protein [Mariprofundus micogutta]
MRTVVISQPMLFPWVGIFEQIRLADTFLYYDDVQFSKGSFTNRVQLKNEKGSEWMTIPLKKLRLGQNINEIEVSDQVDWRMKHKEQLRRCYEKAPFFNEMMDLVESVYSGTENSLSEITILSVQTVCDYFGFTEGREFLRSSELSVEGASSQRVLDLVLCMSGGFYVTGHGAKKYLDHELFESNQVSVGYMDYEMRPYKQLYGEFTPYVSILDLIANLGCDGSSYIASKSIDWKDFINE